MFNCTMRSWGIRKTIALLAICLTVASNLLPMTAHAQAPGDFSLQVTPSPLVSTLKPGAKTTLEIKIHNGGSAAENLKIEPRQFTYNNQSERIDLNDTTPPDIAKWMSFSSPTFTIQPGQWHTEGVTVNLPKDAGFSYSFALVISRRTTLQPSEAGRVLKGSVAIFSLINVDRPGATSSLSAARFAVTRHMYEYLPAELQVQFKNNGNTIVQPGGNIFIQRGTHDKAPIATIAVNAAHGYILPGTIRTLKTTWEDGFPVYKTTQSADGPEQRKLTWNWGDLSRLRIGRYTARLVAVYSDGQRDVPVESEISFWVLPWKILLVLMLVLLLVGFGLWSMVRKVIRLGQRVKRRR